MNRAEFIGNLGKDARIGEANGKTVANFSVAVNEKRNGEESTTWIECSLWGERASKLGQYLTKGKAVFVAGPVSMYERSNKETGEVYRGLSIFVNEIELLGGGEKTQSKPAESKPKADPTSQNPFG